MNYFLVEKTAMKLGTKIKNFTKILWNKIKFNLRQPNECGFYQISKDIEIIPSNKDDFKMTIKDNYPVEDLKTILKFKQERNTPKDQKDIENIIKYIENNKI